MFAHIFNFSPPSRYLVVTMSQGKPVTLRYGEWADQPRPSHAKIILFQEFYCFQLLLAHGIGLGLI